MGVEAAASSGLAFEPMANDFGAMIAGLDLGAIDAATAAQLDEALHRYGVLFHRGGAEISEERFIALGAALGFRAWDQADGVANGTRSALPNDSPLGSGTNTQGSAYSAATDTIPQAVAPVNDAPVAAGTATLAAEAEDTGAPTTATVAALFALSGTVHLVRPGVFTPLIPSWLPEPRPPEPKLSAPGLLFASLISSFSDFAGTDGWTTSTLGTVANSVIGVKSLKVS
jgi:hypothetical protein